MNLILASGSPRRRELLSLYTSDFAVCVSDFDESAVTAPTPARLVEELARGKCLAVSAQHPGAVVIGCDTVVDVKGEVFGKPHHLGRGADRKLRGYLPREIFLHPGSGDRTLRRHRGALRQGRCLRHPRPRSALAGRHRGRLLHHHGVARQPHHPAASTILSGLARRIMKKSGKTC